MNLTAQNAGQNGQDNFSQLKSQIEQAGLPADLAEKLHNQLEKIERLTASSGYQIELDREVRYLEFIISLPFNKSSQDILDLHRTVQILDKNHHGLRAVKDRILEYLSMLILNTRQGTKLKAPVLAFVGLVGSGKTSLAYSVAESLGREVIRIPFGGLGSITELRGQSRLSRDGEPGRLMKSVHDLGFNNPVILLDEIDRIATESRSDVMGVLVELLDPEQNWAFLDRFVDYPFDLSKALFIATANNTGNIATAVLDRLEIIEMPSYNDEEKMVIGRDHILPKVAKEAGLSDNILTIDNTVWAQIIRPLGFDAGIRSLQRTIEGVVRKVAKQVVEGRGGPYHLTVENVGEYLQ